MSSQPLLAWAARKPPLSFPAAHAALLAEGDEGLAQEQGASLTVRDEWDGTMAAVTVEGEIDTATVGALTGLDSVCIVE